jgi:hypothetical protein
MRRIYTDQHAADAIRDLGLKAGLDVVIKTIVPGNEREGAPPNPHVVHRGDMYESLKAAFATRVITIPNDRQLAADVRSVRRKLTATGITYDLPKTSDGRHADYASALAMAVHLMPTSADLRAAGRAAAHARRLSAVGELLVGVAPERVGEVVARAGGYTADEYHESIFSRLARVRPVDASGRQLPGMTPEEMAAHNKFLARGGVEIRTEG